MRDPVAAPPETSRHGPGAVLVVDADTDVRRRVCEALAGHQACAVLDAADAATGVDLLRGNQVDLLVMDLQLDEHSSAPRGLPVLVAAAVARVPVILHTRMSAAEVQALTRAPFLGIVSRPGTMESILALARPVLVPSPHAGLPRGPA